MVLVMNILYLTVKKKWFDLIASNVKKEEYREIKKYWKTRLFKKKFDAVQFKNGYSKDSPVVLVELIDITIGTGFKKWGFTGTESKYILKLGEIIDG